MDERSSRKRPLVSVLVPAYNHARYISDSLTSILRQDYSPLEVLVIDDGSKDGTYEEALAWRRDNSTAFERFEVTRQPNEGANRTFNKLIRASSGPYVLLFASDDIMAPGALTARVNALQAHPEWWAVIGDCDVIDGEGRRTHASAFDLHGADKRALADPRRIRTELVWRWSVPGPALLVDRRVYFAPDGYGLYPEDRIVEDRDFYLWALSKGRIGYIDVRVASYRLHGENVSRVLGPEIEDQNRQAEAKMAGELDLLSNLGLRFRYVIHRIQQRAARSNHLGGRVVWRAARKADHLLTKAVLGVNSRRARRDMDYGR